MVRKAIVTLVGILVIGALIFSGSLAVTHNRLVRSLRTSAANELVWMSSELDQLRARSSIDSAALDGLRQHGASAELYLTTLAEGDVRNSSNLERCKGEVNGRLDLLRQPARTLTGDERRSLDALQQRIEALATDLRR